jgi:tetratricopeptide (TPR) repeat protein
MSRLSRYLDGVMEGTWLVAMACLPLMFVLWGNSVQDAKNYLLRTLGTILFASWTLRVFMHAEPKQLNIRKLITEPLVLPVILFILVTIISMALSLSPWISFWGTAVRRLGVYTTISCVVFFAAIMTTVRSMDQVNRIISVAILTSLSACLYGIEERFHLGPVISRQAGFFRVGSTFGNPVFFGAYIVMIMPLTACRLLVHYVEFRSSGRTRNVELMHCLLYAAVLVIQGWALVLTQSRGPIVGLAVGGFLMFAMVAIYWRKTRLIYVALASGLILLAGLALVVSPRGPFRELAKRSDVKRLASLLSPHSSTSGRSAIWEAASQAGKFSKPMEIEIGRTDPLATIRPFLGYGPETVAFVSRAFTFQEYNIALAGHFSSDRIHNEFWDILLTTGLPGLLVYLWLTFAVMFWACKWLGFISNRTERRLFWSLFLGGGLLGSAGFAAWQGIGFIGVGLRCGSSLGLILFVICRAAVQSSPDALWRKSPIGHVFIVMALLASVVTHLVEINFSFGIETTLLYFWIYIGLVVVIGHRLSSLAPAQLRSVEAAPSSQAAAITETGTGQKSKPSNDRRGRPASAATLSFWDKCYERRYELVGAIFLSLVFANLAILSIQHGNFSSAISGVAAALTHLPGDASKPTLSLLGPIVIASIAFLIVFAGNPAGSDARKSAWKSGQTMAMAAGALSLLFWLAFAKQRMRVFPSSEVRLDNVQAFISGHHLLVDHYYGFLFLAIVLLAALLAGKNRAEKTDRPIAWIGAAIVAVSTLVTVYRTNIRWAKVEAIDRWAETFEGKEQWAIATKICETAIRLTPAAEHQYFFLGKVLTEYAAATKDPAERLSLFTKAEKILEEGSKLRPIDHAFHLRRGNLYLKWAETEQALDKRSALGQKAIDYYKKAAAFDPGNGDVWYRMAYTAMATLQAPDVAAPWLQRALELHAITHFTYGLMGDVSFYKGLSTPFGSERDGILRTAVTNYTQATLLVGTNEPAASFPYWSALGKSYAELKETTNALSAFSKAWSVAPQKERWKTDEILARLYLDIPDRKRALVHVDRAMQSAPARDRDELTRLRSEIESRK